MLLFIIPAAVIFIVWCWATIMASSYGLIGRRMYATAQFPRPMERRSGDEIVPLSVIITAHNQADALQRNLPHILNQEYGTFEVIVVDMCSTDETRTVLERFELQNKRLRHTYTPSGSRDISLERLALTLGIRAAQYEWMVLTHADCHPTSHLWLQSIANTIQPEVTLILGHAMYDQSQKGLGLVQKWEDYKIGFYRLWKEIGLMNHVLRGHAAVSADSCNLAFQRSAFLKGGGFIAGQHLMMGAEELLVNSLSTRHNTRFLLNPDSYVVQERSQQPVHEWQQQRLFYTETRRHQHRTALYRMRKALMLMAPWAILLFVGLPFLAFATFATLLLTLDIEPSQCQQAWDSLAAMLTDQSLSLPVSITVFVGCIALALLVLLFLHLFIKLASFNRTARALACRTYFTTLLLFELQMPFWLLHSRLRHLFTRRNTFRKKFV